MNIDVEIRGQQELIHKINNVSSLAKKDVIEAMNNTVTHYQEQIREVMTHPIPDYAPIDTGKLRDSFIVTNATETKPIARVGTDLVPHHAYDIEYGTRPHFPPITPLVAWAKRKWHLSDKDATGSAFGIARKIAQRGTPARPFFRMATNDVYQFFQKQLVVVANKINQKWRSGI